MRIAKSVAGIAAVGLLVVACGGAGTPTQNPGGGTPTQNPGGGGTPTQNPGGGGGDTTFGKVHVELSGPASKTGDYPFIPVASSFAGDQATSLSFADESSGVVTILVTQGKLAVSYGTEEFSASASTCTTSNLNIGATSASGSFDCSDVLVVLTTGTMAQDGHLKGNFEGHK